MLDLSNYVEVAQAAKILTVHPETVRRLLRQKQLPGIKVGNSWLIARKDLNVFKATYVPHLREKKSHETS
ncbi:MAG: helix-turn-helix domain-containing protein [Chloroflexi bacterium]|nr:helix-turn-helix domain-containing protein [Chloroflexota bacterium]